MRHRSEGGQLDENNRRDLRFGACKGSMLASAGMPV